MFEKSLYDLIRGLRNHKGSEREYIHDSLRECRMEIRGSDMDLKATALLKLIYLEMFGHDMSWASFHVLEVMSSPKYLQKRVGYLGAVQSFRSDTEVLMLATNLLKKDITSPLPPTISLPLVTLPHISNSSMALSLLSDLMPRLSHSNPSIRKKSVVSIYRLALIYPDTLRPAWPRIKDILMDEEEDSSVTAAVINVICELGWRRPRDFLPLAPRLFDLLVDGGNNWMAIKIIKLFATLTPLEPRLIKKLLPPLTTIIRNTPAMSLLYECINGIIQGGIFEDADGVREKDEIASLCVDKLRGMIIVEGDPNLKYVALLAFNKIVTSHPHLVSMHQDVIMSCIDDPDISIRLQALDLGAGMVNSDNLVAVIDRLMRQLRKAPLANGTPADDSRGQFKEVEPAADSDGEDPEQSLQSSKMILDDSPVLPDEYRISIIRQILDMCSQRTYANIVDFDWYIEMLVQLVTLIPHNNRYSVNVIDGNDDHEAKGLTDEDISCSIGMELRNVAVRVDTVRGEAVSAAYSLVAVHANDDTLSLSGLRTNGVLRFAVWIVGEYADMLLNQQDALNCLVHPVVQTLPSATICAYLQSIPKIIVSITSHDLAPWNTERKSMVTFLLARVIHFLEPFSTNPSLEVQERSVEYLELMRVAMQAVKNHDWNIESGPLLLTRAIPSLFTGLELNPVAPSAQKKVPQPIDINLDSPLNRNLQGLLQGVEQDFSADSEFADFERFYNYRPAPKVDAMVAVDALPSKTSRTVSYQLAEDALHDNEMLSKKRAERHGRNKDDPFYIANEDFSENSTPFHDLLKSSNGEDVDVDSIPIMSLDLGDKGLGAESSDMESAKRKRKQPRNFIIASDENIDWEDSVIDHGFVKHGKAVNNYTTPQAQRDKPKKSLLEVDSSGLRDFSLEHDTMNRQLDSTRQEVEDADMARALEEVERLRLEMQRASERIKTAGGVPPEGTLVKKKKRKKRKDLEGAVATKANGDDESQQRSYPADSITKSKHKRKTRSAMARLNYDAEKSG